MSVYKKTSIALLLASIVAFSMPLPTDAAISCPAGQQRNTAGTACVPTPGRFNPSVNLNSGNTYGGLTGGVAISGVGGAIASCTNAGEFLSNTASSLFSAKLFGGLSKSLSSYIPGAGGAVEVSDTKAQNKLTSLDTTSKCLDGVAYAVAKNTLAQVTNKTINWVNTGLNGNPLYVQNVDSFMRTIESQQVRAYLQTVQDSDPIFGNAIASVIRGSITGQTDGLINVAPNTPQARQYDLFMKDFTNGGWSSLLNPRNNPIGALFNATDTLSNNVTTAQNNAAAEIQRNKGFLDLKHCVEFDQSSINNDALSAFSFSTPACKQWVTDTPGSIIASQVETITNSPIRQLEYADKINQVLGGFFDSFVNSLLSRGLRGSGFGSGASYGFSTQGNNIVLNSSGGVLNLNGADLGYQSAGSGLGQDFDISRPQQLKAILQTQYDYLDRAKDAQAALARVVPAVGALDYCMPGPNPTWAQNAPGSLASFTGSLQQASKDNPSVFENVVSALPVVGSFLGSLFFGSKEPPQVWSTPGILNDPTTGMSIKVSRTFFNPSSDFKGGQSTLVNALNTAYGKLSDQYNFYNYTSPMSTSPAGKAFIDAAINDPDRSYVAGFLSDAYNESASLLSYNKAASEIDQQYDTNIGQTQSNIDQMKLIRQQVNDIVARAKTRYIAQRAQQGNPVDMACINKAYVIENTEIKGVGRLEPDPSNDPIVRHSIDAASSFYGEVIK